MQIWVLLNKKIEHINMTFCNNSSIEKIENKDKMLRFIYYSREDQRTLV